MHQHICTDWLSLSALKPVKIWLHSHLLMRQDDNCERLQVRICNEVFVPCNEILMEIMTAIRPAGRPNSNLERHPSLTFSVGE